MHAVKWTCPFDGVHVTGCQTTPRCEGANPADGLPLTSVEAFSPNGDKVS